MMTTGNNRPMLPSKRRVAREWTSRLSTRKTGSITQSQQLLTLIQSQGPRQEAIIFEP